MERREVHYFGQVQGVGFRYTARQIAARYPVTGFVQNLSDGSVLLVAEGSPGELDDFLSDLEAEMERHIGSKTVKVEPATGQFEGFSVRR